jgi:hypothetical protein
MKFKNLIWYNTVPDIPDLKVKFHSAARENSRGHPLEPPYEVRMINAHILI